MNRSKIEWCDHTLNILTGCLHGCPYCYARGMTKRFSGNIKHNITETGKYRKDGEVYILDQPFRDETGRQLMYPFGFAPTYHRYRIGAVLSKLKVGQNVFVGAMADLFGDWVPEYIVNDVLEECGRYPKNNYLFLTKNPQRYADFNLPDSDHYFYGTTVTEQSNLYRTEFLPKAGKKFVSIEPLLEDLSGPLRLLSARDATRIDWIIIGAETGRRKGKVIPKAEWVTGISEFANYWGIPVFMKDSLVDIIGEDSMVRDFQEQLYIRELSDKLMKHRNDRCMECNKLLPKNKMVTLTARAKRSGNTATLGYMCRDCFYSWCAQKGIEVPELEGLE